MGEPTLHHPPREREHKKTPDRSRVLSSWQTGKCLPKFGFLLHTQLSVATPEQPLELGGIDGIRLRVGGKVNDTGPRDVADRARHFLGSRAAGFVPVEHDGDVPGVGVGQELQLLDRDRGAHQGHGRHAQAVEVDRREEALDDDQVLAVLGPVEVEELEALVEARGELVLALPFGKVLLGPDPAAGVGDERPVCVVDGDADAPGHAAFAAVAEAEGGDELGGEAPLSQVRVLGVKGEGEAQRLVRPDLPSLTSGLPRAAWSALWRVCRGGRAFRREQRGKARPGAS